MPAHLGIFPVDQPISACACFLHMLGRPDFIDGFPSNGSARSRRRNMLFSIAAGVAPAMAAEILEIDSQCARYAQAEVMELYLKKRKWRDLMPTMSNKRFAFLAIGLCFGCAAIAQQAPPAAATAPSGPAWSPSQNIGLFAFPKNNQTADQQLKDEADCYGMAKQRTGIDAQARPPQGLSEEEKKAAQQQAAKNAPQAQGGRAVGAARGAAGGAAIGAIAGNAGKGAGAGAVAGTMRGGMTQKQANAQSQQQAAAQAAAAQKKAEEQMLLQHQEGVDTFQRAFIACMDARNYSVK